MRLHTEHRHGITGVIVAIVFATLPVLVGCQSNKASASVENKDLRKQLQHPPSEGEVHQALEKAPPEIRAMVEAQMSQSKQGKRPDAPQKTAQSK